MQAGLAEAAARGLLRPDIRADSNRDGRVDVVGDSDLADKREWSDAAGALMLANIGDTDGRCSHLVFSDSPSDGGLDACNNADDDEARSPRFLAPVHTLPMGNLSAAATGTVGVAEAEAARKVRVFARGAGGAWRFVAGDDAFDSAQLAAGLELGVDARDVRRPNGWDGRATLVLRVRDGGAEAEDAVMLRVAPVLAHHVGQAARQLVATEARPWAATHRALFLDALRRAGAAAALPKPLFAFPWSWAVVNSDVDMDGDAAWAQDLFEPGYTSMPGPDGRPRALRIMVRAAQHGRAGGRLPFRYLRSAGAGAVGQHRHRWWDAEVRQLVPEPAVDALGNLDTVPPHTHGGRRWPAGRVVLGTMFGYRPLVWAFVTAQEAQAPPIGVDVSWLAGGRVEEFMHFLPAAGSARGWRVVVSDPLAGLELLRRLQRTGLGNVDALSRPLLAGDPAGGCLPRHSVNQVLRFHNLTGLQQYSADAIEAAVDVLRRETGLGDGDIVRVPALYFEGDWTCGKGADLEEGWEGGEPEGIPEVSALYPAAVNGVLLGPSRYLAPRPWGPVVDGRDVLAEAIEAAYAQANVSVSFIDDWFAHHVRGGNVHRATNVLRETGGAWWR